MALKAKAQKRVAKPVSAKKLAGAAARAKQTGRTEVPTVPASTPAEEPPRVMPQYEQVPIGGEGFGIVAREATEAEPLVMEFRSAAEVRIMILALVDREKKLDDLAKKNNEGGYPREALVQKQDRVIIQRRLLSQLQPQISMNLDGDINIVDVCTEVVGRSLRSNLRKRLVADAVAQLTNDGVPNAKAEADARTQHVLEQFEESVGNIAELAGAAVVPLLDGLYQNAFTKGRLAYNQSPAAVTKELAVSLRDGVNELVA